MNGNKIAYAFICSNWDEFPKIEVANKQELLDKATELILDMNVYGADFHVKFHHAPKNERFECYRKLNNASIQHRGRIGFFMASPEELKFLYKYSEKYHLDPFDVRNWGYDLYGIRM